MKAETHVVAQTSPSHGLEGFFRHVKGRRLSRPRVVSHEEHQVVRSGKLGSPSEPSVVGVESGEKIAVGALEGPFVQGDGSRPGRSGPRAAHRLGYLAGGIHDLLPFLFPQPAYPRNELDHPDPSVTVLLRYVGRREKRLSSRGHDHIERPPAVSPREHVADGHVDVVYVGALLPVHLHRNEGFVHEPGHFGVLEGFALHDVAPVAGRVSYREEYRPVLPFRRLKRLVSPRIPVDGVFRVLEKVGTFFVSEPVCHRSLRYRAARRKSIHPLGEKRTLRPGRGGEIISPPTGKTAPRACQYRIFRLTLSFKCANRCSRRAWWPTGKTARGKRKFSW